MEDRSPLIKKKRGLPIKVTFVVGEKGILQTSLASHTNAKEFVYEIIEQVPSPLVVSLIEKWVDSYCKKKQPDVLLPLAIDTLPPYTTQVLSILREVPFGVTLSYRELAEITGNPKGARAVGNACARNPCPLLIPCHRVLGAGGKLGGFSAGEGVLIKQTLLDYEKK
jgi:methylated-DNA-[protein]-cysteine S-methyltransferase